MYSQITNQRMQFIKKAGYQYSKDDLGFYFDNGKQRFSIMKTGPIFQCYQNIKTESGWVLKQRSNGILQFDECLTWILNIIQRGI